MKGRKIMLPRQIGVGPMPDQNFKLLQFPARSGQMKWTITKIAYLVYITQHNTTKTRKFHIKFQKLIQVHPGNLKNFD